MFRFMYAVSVLTAVTAGPVTALVARAPTGTQALNASGPASELMQRSQLVQRGAPPSNPGTLTINIKNDFGVPLLAKVASNPGTAGPANAGKLVLADSLTYHMPRGWGGNIQIGKTIRAGNSLIEADSSKGNYIDVSYVDGFSIPITCSCDGEVKTGCNIPLFHNGKTCSRVEAGPTCMNKGKDGHSVDPFFSDCRGAAYIFPSDDGSTRYCKSNTINCCVGATCPAPARQPKHHRL